MNTTGIIKPKYNIEIKKWSRHWAIRITNEKGQLVACHSCDLKNTAYKKKIIARYR